MTIPQPPPGQGPVDPRGAFSAPPPPGAQQQQFHQPQPGMYPPGPMPMPMPMMMPPPYFPPPPLQRGGFARGIFMTLATAIFGMSITLNIYLLLISGVMGGGGDGSRQNVLHAGDPKQKIAVVPLSGIIDETARERFEKVIRRLESDETIKALVVEVNSPGGSVGASDEIYAALVNFKQKRQAPVVVAMGELAASGGYYVSCAADTIVAERTTLTGSIGVLMQHYDLSKLADKWGIEDATMHSTGADFKTVGSMFKPMSEPEQKYIRDLIDDAFGTFKTVVQTGRGARLKAPMSDIANGKIFTAAQALQMGLIDQVGYAKDAHAAAAKLAGLDKHHIVRYEPMPSLFDVFGAESKAQTSPQGVTINGVNLNIDSSLLHQLTTPRLMYLWRGQ